MTSMNISLPKPMRNWIDLQVKSGGYGTASEFVRELIRDAQTSRARKELEAKLIEGLESGTRIPVNDEYWQDLRNRVTKRNGKRKKGARR